MKVFIPSQDNRDRLIKAFTDVGAEVVERFKPLTDDVKLIVPTVDEELLCYARSKDWFRSKGIEVLIASEETIRTCRDKAEFYRFCRRHGFDTPETMQDVLIAKPRFGKGSKGQLKIDRSYIVQQFIDWPEYSVDYVADFDGRFQSVVPRKRLNVVNGESQAAEFVTDKVLIDESVRLGTELKLCGHNVMQCFYNGERIKWIEVNPRFGGGSWMTFNLFNSPKFFVDLLSGPNAMPKMPTAQTKSQDTKD